MQSQIIVYDVRLRNIAHQFFQKIKILIQVDTVNIYFALGRGKITTHTVQNGGFTGTGTSDDGNQLAGLDIQADMIACNKGFFALATFDYDVRRIYRNTALVATIGNHR